MTRLSISVSPTQSLLKALVGAIENSKASATHLRETEAFLDSLRVHLEWYDSVLALVDGDEEFAPYVIDEISKAIYHVVEPVKQLCEGTTDRIPFELAVLLERELRDATGEQVRVALCPLPNLNFVYADVGADIRQLFNGLSDWISREVLDELPDAANQVEVKRIRDERPGLPSSHILIAFQYAMADDILFNSVLFHELGHHVFHKPELWDAYRAKFQEELNEVLKNEFPDARHSSGAASLILTRAVDACTRWASEIFSDCFACALVGPHFAFAMDDLFRLKAKPRPNVFSSSHPADRVRQDAQYHALESCGWLVPDAEIDSSFAEGSMEIFGKLRENGLSDNPEDWNVTQWNHESLVTQARLPATMVPRIIQVFLRHIREIGEEALKEVKDCSDRSNEFWQLGPAVKKALEGHAIVPSTIVVCREAKGVAAASLSRGPITTFTYHPRPSTVLNCARLIIETGTGALLKTCFPEKPPPYGWKEKARVRYLLSEWTRKAIGDYNLLQDARNGHQ